MFDNSGGKIKIVAIVLFWVGLVVSFVAGLDVMMAGMEKYSTLDVIGGFVVTIAGGVGSWIGALVLYGFGTLVMNSEDIVDKLYDDDDEKGAGR